MHAGWEWEVQRAALHHDHEYERPNPDLDLCRYVTHAEIGGGPAAPLVVDELLTMLIMGPLLGPAYNFMGNRWCVQRLGVQLYLPYIMWGKGGRGLYLLSLLMPLPAYLARLIHLPAPHELVYYVI